MIRREFAVERHEEYGEPGYRPIGVDHADPLGAMALAHDVLEHFPNDDGGLECEFMALGAAAWIRGTGGWFSGRTGNPDSAENIGSDFLELAQHFLHESFRLRDPGRTQALGDEGEEILTGAIRYGMGLCRDELGPSRYEGKEYPAPDGYSEWISDETQRRILGWMRKGYRKAVRRYAGTSAYEMAGLFDRIEKRANKWLRENLDAEAYGTRVVVSVNVKEMDFSLKEILKNDYDY